MDDYNIISTKTNYDKKSCPTLCWNCRYATGIPLNAEHRTFEPKVCVQSYAPDRTEPPVTTPRPTHRCPWITNNKPVKGWKAVETTLPNYNSNVVKSFQIKSCPLYEPDLVTQIEGLSNEEVALYVDLPQSFVNKLPDITREVLYKMIERWNEYTLIILDKVNQGRLSQATEIINNNLPYHYAAPLLLTDLLASPTPLSSKIRNLAIKELVLWYEIDHKDGEDLTALSQLKDLKELIRKIKKLKQVAKNKAIKEGKRNG